MPSPVSRSFVSLLFEMMGLDVGEREWSVKRRKQGSRWLLVTNKS